MRVSVSDQNPSRNLLFLSAAGNCWKGWTHIESFGGGPDTVALGVEDGGFVDVASADKAVQHELLAASSLPSSVSHTSGRRRL